MFGSTIALQKLGLEEYLLERKIQYQIWIGSRKLQQWLPFWLLAIDASKQLVTVQNPTCPTTMVRGVALF